MSQFDYSAPAEFFRRKTRGKGPSVYLRFDTAAAAIGHAVEGQAELDLNLTTLEVDGERWERGAIRELYDSGDYPLTRKTDPRRRKDA
jgi:hypothetical protein